MMLCGALGALLTMTSCLGSNDNDGTTYSDTAITAITLGTLNRYTQTTSSSTGNDTIIKSTLTGSTYHLTIDQMGCRIHNENDVLPVGTDLAHVVISSLSTKNNGIATLKSLTSDSVTFISTSDSIDFSKPRVIRVFSSNLDYYRDYTVTLIIDPDAGLTFEWKKADTRSDLQGWTDKHLVTFGDSIRLTDQNVVTSQDVAYRLNNQELERSEDMENWTPQGAAPLKQLLGSDTFGLYGFGLDGSMMCLPYGSDSWQTELLDDDAALLPTNSVAMAIWDYAPLDDADYLLMVGNDAEGNVRSWRKICQYGEVEKGGTWVFMPVDLINRYTLPQQQNLSLTYYKDVLLALGSSRVIYQSTDQGITWKPSAKYTLPTTIQGSLITMSADNKGRLWLVTDAGEIWQGALR